MITRRAYKRIQQIAYSMAQWTLLGKEKTEKCTACGSQAWRTVWDHRNYCHPFDVVEVCGGCNAKLGPGAIDFYNVETLDMIRIKFKRVVGGRGHKATA